MHSGIFNGPVNELIDLIETGIKAYQRGPASIESDHLTSAQGTEPMLIQEIIADSHYYNLWFVAGDMLYGFQVLTEDLRLLSQEIIKLPAHDYGNRTMYFLLETNTPFEGIGEVLFFATLGFNCKLFVTENLKRYISQLIRLFDQTAFKDRIALTDKPAGMDGVVVMRSINSTLQSYLKKYPSVQLHSEGSTYVATGYEDEQQWQIIADMTCRYFGRARQSVKVLFVPEGFDVSVFRKSLEHYAWQLNHHKYYNNFDYRRSSMIVGKCAHEIAGPLLLTDNADQAGYTGVLCIQTYTQHADILNNKLTHRFPVVQETLNQTVQPLQIISGFGANLEKISAFILLFK